MTELLQGIAAVASFLAVLYAPFHYLDQFASPEAKAGARNAIRLGKMDTDTRPLASLLEAFFGPKHLTVRCFVLSSLMSLVFTVLFLGMVNAYVLDLVTYLDNYTARIKAIDEKLHEALKGIATVNDSLIAELEKKIDTQEDRRLLEELKANKGRVDKLRETRLTAGAPLLLWMMLSVAISMNLLCDYVALGKTRVILRQISKTESRPAIGAYLLLDLLLAVIIWTASIAIFVLINREPFIAWSTEAPILVAVVGIVSLATTVATSIWIYTFLAGTFVSIFLRRFIRLLLRGATGLIDARQHTFKIIGIVGSVATTSLLGVALLVFKLTG